MQEIKVIEKNYNVNINYKYENGSYILDKISGYNFNFNLSFSSIEDFVKVIKNILNIKEDSNIVPMFFRKTDDKEEIEEDAFCDNVIDFPIKKKINFFSDMTDAQWSRAVLCMNNIHKPVTEQDEEYKKLHTGVSFLK